MTRLEQGPRDLLRSLDGILAEALVTSRTHLGNIQLLDTSRDELGIVASHGFADPFLTHFRTVTVGDGSACARALRTTAQIVIPDVDVDREFAPHRSVALAAGFRAVQSTPIHGRFGKPLGILSTHFASPCQVPMEILDTLRRHAAAAGAAIEAARGVAGPLRVMLVGSDGDLADLLREVMADLGHVFEAVSDVDAAVRRSRDCDVALVRVQRRRDADVVGRLLGTPRATPLRIVALAPPEWRPIAGVDGHVFEPFDLDDLSDAIQPNPVLASRVSAV